MHPRPAHYCRSSGTNLSGRERWTTPQSTSWGTRVYADTRQKVVLSIKILYTTLPPSSEATIIMAFEYNTEGGGGEALDSSYPVSVPASQKNCTGGNSTCQCVHSGLNEALLRSFERWGWTRRACSLISKGKPKTNERNTLVSAQEQAMTMVC